jgi:predicted phosphodiesterase
LNIIEIDKPDQPMINLYAVGDLHIGDLNCEYTMIQDTIDRIKADPYALVIGMGDWLNVATKHSVGKAVFDQEYDTTQQLKIARRMFLPIKDKLVGLLEGNHEYRLSKEGFNITDVMAETLDTEFLGYSTLLSINIQGTRYVVYATHGHGGGSTKGGVVNKLKKLDNVVNADIYLRGHSHQLLHFKQPIRSVSPVDNSIIETERWYVDTGSFLSYDDSYAEKANFTPANLGSPIITLFPDRINITI